MKSGIYYSFTVRLMTTYRAAYFQKQWRGKKALMGGACMCTCIHLHYAYINTQKHMRLSPWAEKDKPGFLLPLLLCLGFSLAEAGRTGHSPPLIKTGLQGTLAGLFEKAIAQEQPSQVSSLLETKDAARGGATELLGLICTGCSCADLKPPPPFTFLMKYVNFHSH